MVQEKKNVLLADYFIFRALLNVIILSNRVAKCVEVRPLELQGYRFDSRFSVFSFYVVGKLQVKCFHFAT